MGTIEKVIKIKAPTDFKSRAASLLVEKSNRIRSNFYISTEKTDRRVLGGSKLGILSLNIRRGDIIIFTIIGNDDMIIEHDQKVIYEIIEEIERR